VEANLLAMDVPLAAGKVYNVACGERVTLNRLLDELQDLLGTDVEPTYAAARPGDMRHTLADLSLARAELGYDPAVRLQDGLRRTVDAYLTEDIPERLGA